MNLPPPHPINMAAAVADAVMETGEVLEVYLFGSTAKGEPSMKDLELILVVPDAYFMTFLDFAQGTTTAARGYETPEARYYAAQRILCWDTAELAALHPGLGLDVFLLPPRWLAELGRLERLFHNSNPEFWRNVAATARRYDPKAQSFEPIPATEQLYEAGGLLYTYSVPLGRAVIVVDEPTPSDHIREVAGDIGAKVTNYGPGGHSYAVEICSPPGARAAHPQLYTAAALRDALALRFASSPV